jgi:uncharacterized membrane protein YcaP (DUF421 family)
MQPALHILAASAPTQWLGSSWMQAAMVAVSTVAIFAAVIALTRLAGLRSFSQMSSFDLAMTVAIGSLMASTASSPSTTLVNGTLALTLLYVVQIAIAKARLRMGASTVVDNHPLLLMHEGRILHENLRRARVAERDLWAKLRHAGVTDPDEVLAVVFETTAEISVLQGDGPVDRRLLEGVRGAPVSAERRGGAR